MPVSRPGFPLGWEFLLVLSSNTAMTRPGIVPMIRVRPGHGGLPSPLRYPGYVSPSAECHWQPASVLGNGPDAVGLNLNVTTPAAGGPRAPQALNWTSSKGFHHRPTVAGRLGASHLVCQSESLSASDGPRQSRVMIMMCRYRGTPAYQRKCEIQYVSITRIRL
eukprot:1697696-Rhodomonas_salina.1